MILRCLTLMLRELEGVILSHHRSDQKYVLLLAHWKILVKWVTSNISGEIHQKNIALCIKLI